jgi:hypothetical protein
MFVLLDVKGWNWIDLRVSTAFRGIMPVPKHRNRVFNVPQGDSHLNLKRLNVLGVYPGLLPRSDPLAASYVVLGAINLATNKPIVLVV